ncbi:MAG: DUF1080 domain-containing protein [Proteiniphilum sp.]|jgi:hypothetical protein|nr:DUF1080 domain-containing protein [Proteiniphilum sp.]
MQTAKLLSITILSLLLAGSCGRQSGSIFNGKDLSNWHFVLQGDSVPGDQVFTVDQGVITVKGEPLGYMYTKEKYADFILELEYRWAEEASNSGVFILIEDPANPFPKGIECQLAAGNAGDFVLLNGADLNEYSLPEGATERPRFPVIGKLHPSSEKTAGEWNRMQVTVTDGTVTVFVNDVLQNEASGKVKAGHIGLQSEGGKIQFRNLLLRKL